MQRLIMVFSCVFMFFSLILCTLSLPCSTLFEENKCLKIGSSVLAILAGVFTLSMVSWYAFEVVHNYHQQVLIRAPIVFEFGAALYAGWVSSVSFIYLFISTNTMFVKK